MQCDQEDSNGNIKTRIQFRTAKQDKESSESKESKLTYSDSDSEYSFEACLKKKKSNKSRMEMTLKQRATERFIQTKRGSAYIYQPESIEREWLLKRGKKQFVDFDGP